MRRSFPLLTRLAVITLSACGGGPLAADRIDQACVPAAERGPPLTLPPGAPVDTTRPSPVERDSLGGSLGVICVIRR
jgi:hypothetical protein